MFALIVDDEHLARERLKRIASEYEGLEVVGEAGNGIEALAKIEELDPDLVFLDIKMPGMDGLTAAKHIAKLEDPPGIIFCTAYDEFAIDAFDTLAFGYLVKPVQKEALDTVLSKAGKLTKVNKLAIEAGSDQRQSISAKTHQGIRLIPIDEIACFVADQKYVTIRADDGSEVLIDETLKELEEEFQERFLRVHRNTLVSIPHIKGLKRSSEGQYTVDLKTIDYEPVISRRHVSQVKAVLANL